jgi:hypothetical protein
MKLRPRRAVTHFAHRSPDGSSGQDESDARREHPSAHDTLDELTIGHEQEGDLGRLPTAAP